MRSTNLSLSWRAPTRQPTPGHRHRNDTAYARARPRLCQPTVAHFHWAGFGLTALFTVLRDHRAARIGLVLHQFGMVCVAMGLSFDDRFEVLGAGLLVGALALYSVAALQQRAGLNDSVRRTLLLISSVAWIAPMALATTWAFAPFGVTPIADRYESMLRYHGAVNAIGLVLVGLIAVVPRRRGARLPHTVTHTQKGPRHADALISHQ